MRLGKLARQRQAEAERSLTSSRSGFVEPRENLLLLLGIDARAIVDDVDGRGFLVATGL